MLYGVICVCIDLCTLCENNKKIKDKKRSCNKVNRKILSDSEDTDNGLWTSTYTYLQTSPSGKMCSGCTCDTDLHYVVSCTGSTV